MKTAAEKDYQVLTPNFCKVKCITHFNLHSTFSLILQRKKLKLGKVKQAAHGHIATNGHSRNPTPLLSVAKGFTVTVSS